MNGANESPLHASLLLGKASWLRHEGTMILLIKGNAIHMFEPTSRTLKTTNEFKESPQFNATHFEFGEREATE